MEHLEIIKHEGVSYKPLVHFESWRVAAIRYEAYFDRKNFSKMERHMLTDEVFILVEGSAQLIIGGNGDTLEPLYAHEMEKGTVYNVKKNVWHSIFVSPGSYVIIVENDDTSDDNSESIGVDGVSWADKQ